MSLTIIDLGTSRALFFGHKIVQEFDYRKCPAMPSNITETLDSIVTTAKAISRLFGCPIKRGVANEDEQGDWTWQGIAEKYIRNDNPSIKLEIGCYSDDATRKGKVDESISLNGIRDIVDGANHLVAVARGITINKCDENDFAVALDELNEALMAADTHHNDEAKKVMLPVFKVSR